MALDGLGQHANLVEVVSRPNMLEIPWSLWTIRLKKLDFPRFCEPPGWCWNLQGFCGPPGWRCWKFQGFCGPPCWKCWNFQGFVDYLQFLGLLQTTNLKTPEFVGFFGDISRVWSLPHFARVVQGTLRCHLCREIAIRTWKKTTTCVGAQTWSRHFACHHPIPGVLRKRKMNCPENCL